MKNIPAAIEMIAAMKATLKARSAGSGDPEKDRLSWEDNYEKRELPREGVQVVRHVLSGRSPLNEMACQLRKLDSVSYACSPAFPALPALPPYLP